MSAESAMHLVKSGKDKKARDHNFEGVTRYKIGVVLYRMAGGHPEILVEQATLTLVNDNTTKKGNFQLLQDDLDPTDTRMGHNAYRFMHGKFGLTKAQVQLLEVNPEPKVLHIPLAFRARKEAALVSTRWTLMELKDISVELEKEGGKYCFLTPPEVLRFSQYFRLEKNEEVLRFFNFELPL